MKNGRTDANQFEIVQALKQIGCSVHVMSDVGAGFPDIVVGVSGKTLLLEIKDGPKQKLTPAQTRWHSEWRGHAVVVDSIDAAIEACNKARRS